jgi:hypothetical protein
MPSTSMPEPAAGLGSLLAARWPRCSLCIIGMTPRPGSVVCGRVAPAPTPASAAAANSSATARSPIANLAISAASLMTRRVSRGRQSRAAVRHTVMLRPKGARLVRAGNAMPTDRVVQYGIVRMASAAAVPNSGRRAPFPRDRVARTMRVLMLRFAPTASAAAASGALMAFLPAPVASCVATRTARAGSVSPRLAVPAPSIRTVRRATTTPINVRMRASPESVPSELVRCPERTHESPVTAPMGVTTGSRASGLYRGSQPVNRSLRCHRADRWVSTPNGAPASPGRDRSVSKGPMSAPWRSAFSPTPCWSQTILG